MITITSVEAQNRFGRLLDAVQREPIIVTRNGRTAAFQPIFLSYPEATAIEAGVCGTNARIFSRI